MAEKLGSREVHRKPPYKRIIPCFASALLWYDWLCCRSVMQQLSRYSKWMLVSSALVSSRCGMTWEVTERGHGKCHTPWVAGRSVEPCQRGRGQQLSLTNCLQAGVNTRPPIDMRTYIPTHATPFIHKLQ